MPRRFADQVRRRVEVGGKQEIKGLGRADLAEKAGRVAVGTIPNRKTHAPQGAR
jgi:hypothetical protein